MRGKETVQVRPQALVDPIRGPIGGSAAPYDLKKCIVIPRASYEEGKGYVGILGYTVVYWGKASAPELTAKILVRDETHEIEGVQDFRQTKRGAPVIIQTLQVGAS